MGDKKDNTITGTTTERKKKDYVNNSSLSFDLNDLTVCDEETVPSGIPFHTSTTECLKE